MVAKKVEVPKNAAVVPVAPVRRQVQPWRKPAKKPAKKVKADVDVNWRKTVNGRKLIIIDAKAGTEGIRIEVSNGQQFEVRADEEARFECWVSKKYSVKVYQGGKLIGEQAAMRKQGLN